MKTAIKTVIFATTMAFSFTAQAYSGTKMNFSTSQSNYNRVQAAAHKAQDDIYLYLATDGQEVRATLLWAIEEVKAENAEMQLSNDEALNILIDSLKE